LTYILGLNINHADTSAVIFNDSNLIAAAEEERFTRVKHEINFPLNAIRFCLAKAKINISQVNYITLNSKPLNSILRKFFFFLLNPKSYPLFIQNILSTKNKLSVRDFLNQLDVKNSFTGKVRYYDHHLSHLASSFYYSPFKKSVNFSLDGFGDFASCSWGVAKNNELKIDGKIFFPHSLGIFYQAITQYLGFKNYGDEYKVMGLSSYGNPVYTKLISNLVYYKKNFFFQLNLKYFCNYNKRIISFRKNQPPFFLDLYSNELVKLLGPERKKKEEITQRHKDIAKSAQVVFENVFFNLLNDLYDKYKIQNLNLSGGCAMNSVANGKITSNTNFKNIYVSSNPGDAGGAIGSALCLLNDINKKKIYKKYKDPLPYLGDSFSNDEIETVIYKYKLKNKFEVKKLDNSQLFIYVAILISKSNIVGWFQGGMEWGARALGNRSILADPRNPKMKELLNLKIKKRENFRPFAPSIIYEHMHKWFETKCPVPYMSEVYKIKENKRSLIPAVTHIDGTGRLQTVTKANGRFYSLLSAFYKKTNVPIVLNTSFNENEPIVRTPEEAIECYLRTKIDVLVIENWVIKRI
jgi:carbamoyltransferase